jgi:hypothetical protein
MNAVIAAGEEEPAFGIEDRGGAKHRKRRRGCRRQHTCCVVAGSDGTTGGVQERLLELRVGGTRQDEHGEEETEPAGDRTRGVARRQTTSGVQAEEPGRHLCFLVANRGRVERTRYS